jgi:hypothetical protein
VIITGQQGSGKNCFTDVPCELFRGYSSTITDLNDIIQYNESLFGKVFVVLDEMEKAKKGNSKAQQQLKALITKSMIQFKGKYKVTHEEKNTTNFFILSNNKVPFEIEMDDRHFFILKTNGKYTNDHTYFSALMKSFDSSFYSHLLTFLFGVDLKEFDSRKIPYTDAKKEMQNCSCSDPMLQWIKDNYDSLVDGMDCREAAACRPDGVKKFHEEILEYCFKTRIMKNYDRTYFFKLKNEWRDRLKKVVEFGKKRAPLDEEGDDDGIEDENNTIEDDANDNTCDWAGDNYDDDRGDDGDITFENSMICENI